MSGFGFDAESITVSMGGFFATSFALANVLTQFQYIPAAAALEHAAVRKIGPSPRPPFALGGRPLLFAQRTSAGPKVTSAKGKTGLSTAPYILVK